MNTTDTEQNDPLPNQKHDNFKFFMINQPSINIGTAGAVSDGKSTLIKQLTGIQTQRHSKEFERNITIKAGYANAKFWRDEDGEYYTTDSTHDTYTTNEGFECTLENHVSFVDCPGHETLISTTLASTSIMDGVILIVGVDQPISMKPQLIQHVAAIKLAKIDKIIICMNKIDLVSKDTFMERHQELIDMLEQYEIVPYTIIPTCFNKKIGLEHLKKAIMELFNPCDYLKKTSESPLFRISRTFNVDKPGTHWRSMVGGVLGGTLTTGTLKIGDEIEIRPGQVSKNKNGIFTCQPIRTTIRSIKTDETNLDEIIPGGLSGLGTDIDPYYCKSDTLTGHVVGMVGHMPSVFSEIIMDINIVTTFGFRWVPKVNDIVTLQIGTKTFDAKLSQCTSNNCKFQLSKPCCISDNQHIIICRHLDKILKIVAEGTILYSENTSNILLV